MSLERYAKSRCPVVLPRRELRRMVGVVRLLHGVSGLGSYRELIAPELPELARFDPGNQAVMMGYDFHLGPDGARLIEVNTNAGGGWMAWRAAAPGVGVEDYSAPLLARVVESFRAELRLQRRDPGARLRRVVILDESPAEQFLFPEMEWFVRLFAAHGIAAGVADPCELELGRDGVSWRGEPVEVIYNRHCDFYLQTTELAGVAAEYRAGRVCVTPNPRAYGVLADKRRLPIFSDSARLAELGVRVAPELVGVIPPCWLLSGLGRERAWKERNRLIFKPVARFGSKGVLAGRGISRARFEELEPELTLVQELVPPSRVVCPGEPEPLKVDFRLFVYQARVLGVAARIYQGQVTNFRHPASGYAPVVIG